MMQPEISFQGTGFTHVNEALNLPHNCIFIAVPKTGSNSIRSQLRQKGKPMVPGPHLNICQIRDLIYPAFLRASLGKNRSFPSTLPLTDQVLREAADRTFTAAFKFACVRNPWARAVSLYARREGILLQEHIPFETFVEHHLFASDTCVYPTLHKTQSEWLCDPNGILLMDYVFKLEDFDRAIRDIAEMTEGRLVLESVHENRNVTSQSDVYRDLYTGHTRTLISKHFEADIDRFKFTF